MVEKLHTNLKPCGVRGQLSLLKLLSCDSEDIILCRQLLLHCRCPSLIEVTLHKSSWTSIAWVEEGGMRCPRHHEKFASFLFVLESFACFSVSVMGCLVCAGQHRTIWY